MPLRNPLYLNRADFFDQAEYHEIEIPRRVEVQARTSTSKGGRARAGLEGVGIPFGIEGHAGGNVEMQSAYVLERGEKATFSKVLDAMERGEGDALKALPLDLGGDRRWQVQRDDLVELRGTMTLSPVSSVGKLMNVVKQLMGHDEVDLDSLTSTSIPRQAQEILKAVYLRNEIPEIPALFKLDLDGETAPWRVFVSCAPGHFVGEGAAATDSIEGPVTVLGVIRDFVGDGLTPSFGPDAL